MVEEKSIDEEHNKDNCGWSKSWVATKNNFPVKQ
jgi:hypothetical protein